MPQANLRVLGRDVANIVLTTLRDAARISTIPYLSAAAALALGILDIIQGTQDNKDAFQRLADDACGLVYAAILYTKKAKDNATGISEDLLDHLRELQGYVIAAWDPSLINIF